MSGFCLLALGCVLDIVDTLLKSEEHFSYFDGDNLISTPIMVAICLIAIVTES